MRMVVFSVRRFVVLMALILLSALIILSLWLGYNRFLKEKEIFFPSLLKGYTVIIDPGHGGYDPGSVRDGVIEKDIVIDISLALQDLLKRTGAKVVMTRDADYDLLEIPSVSKKRQDLNNRLKIINEADGDILVSIHVNAIISPEWSGAQTFYSPDNQFDESKRLAFLIQEELISTLQNTDRYAKMANYLILQESPVPSVLIEVGFISNPREKELLCDPEYRKKIVIGIAKGIFRYFAGQRADEPDFPVADGS